MPCNDAPGVRPGSDRLALWRPWLSMLGICASALLLWLANTIPGCSWIGWIALAPWLAALRPGATHTATLSGLSMGLAYAIPGHWQAFMSAVIASGEQGVAATALTLAFFLTYAFPFAVFAVLNMLQQRWIALSPMATPLFQAGVLASLVSLVWTPFGYTPATIVVDQRALLQVAELGGEPLVLLLMFWSSAALAAVFTGAPLRAKLAPVLPAALAMAVAGSFGSARLAMLADDEAAGGGHILRVLPLQLDLPLFAARSTLLRDRPGQARSAIELTRRGLDATPQCDLVLWPEVPLSFADTDAVCAQGAALARSLGRPLLMQCYQPAQERRQVTATLFEPDGPRTQSHAKSRLVPLYEKPIWGAHGAFIEGAAGTVFGTHGLSGLIPTLCYELHSRLHLRQALLRGGDVVLHMASFTPFARTQIDRWDQRMARILAVEFRLPVVRAANRGAVGWIDATGRVRSRSAQIGSSARCIEMWIPSHGMTPAAWLGSLTGWLPALVAALLMPAGAGRSLRRGKYGRLDSPQPGA